MKKLQQLAALLVFCTISGVTFAGYADDRAEIVNLSNRYIVAVDAGDIETVMSTWADGGVLEWVYGVENGKEAIRSVMSNFAGGRYVEIPEGATSRTRMRHQIINHVIDIDGDTATSYAYWFNMSNDTTHGNVVLGYFGHYEDILEKQNGQWLFTKRSVYNESQQNRAVFYPGLGEIDPRTRTP